jgi:hypothetical protein
MVYQMTKAMFTHLPELVAAHAAAKGISLKDAPLNSPVPLHRARPSTTAKRVC